MRRTALTSPSSRGNKREVFDTAASISHSAQAPNYFHAAHFGEAIAPARAFLRNAQLCALCTRALSHVYERIGSTLFRDDDPQKLLLAFAPEEQNECTLKVLAALIVLRGRDRVLPSDN